MGIVFGSAEALAIAKQNRELELKAEAEEARAAALADGRLKRFRVSAMYRAEWNVEVDATDKEDAERVFMEQAETGDVLDALENVTLTEPDFISVREIS